MSTSNQTPGQGSPENATAVADPSAADAGADPRSFAERVGRRKPASGPDPFEIAVDVVAGVRLFESKRDRQMAIKFGEGGPEDRPSQTVIDKLKAAGFHWDRKERIWAHPVTAASGMSDRIDAERLYQEIRGMIRQDRGAGSGQDVPF
jgi:hypothetical protein